MRKIIAYCSPHHNTLRVCWMLMYDFVFAVLIYFRQAILYNGKLWIS